MNPPTLFLPLLSHLLMSNLVAYLFSGLCTALKTLFSPFSCRSTIAWNPGQLPLLMIYVYLIWISWCWYWWLVWTFPPDEDTLSITNYQEAQLWKARSCLTSGNDDDGVHLRVSLNRIYEEAGQISGCPFSISEPNVDGCCFLIL